MATFNMFNQLVEDIAHGVHNFATSGGHTLKFALTAAASAPTATMAVVGDLTEISYTNLANSGNRVLSQSGSAQTSGTYKLSITDRNVTASGGSLATFRYVVLFNDSPTSPADPLICWYDYGGDVSLADGESLQLDFSDANGLFQIS